MQVILISTFMGVLELLATFILRVDKKSTVLWRQHPLLKGNCLPINTARLMPEVNLC